MGDVNIVVPVDDIIIIIIIIITIIIIIIIIQFIEKYWTHIQ